MRTFEWAIEDIVAAYPWLTLEADAAMAVALTQQAVPPCDFLVEIDGFGLADLDEDRQFVLRLTWTTETAARARRMLRTKQRSPIAEGGAIALAALLFSHLLPGSEWEVTIRGDGADYWLPKLSRALEISGTERYTEMARRKSKKRTQLLANSSGAGWVRCDLLFRGIQPPDTMVVSFTTKGVINGQYEEWNQNAVA